MSFWIDEMEWSKAPQPPTPYCGRCEEGWIRVPDHGARKLYGDQRATKMIRCECRGGAAFKQYDKRVVAWKAPKHESG